MNMKNNIEQYTDRISNFFTENFTLNMSADCIDKIQSILRRLLLSVPVFLLGCICMFIGISLDKQSAVSPKSFVGSWVANPNDAVKCGFKLNEDFTAEAINLPCKFHSWNYSGGTLHLVSFDENNNLTQLPFAVLYISEDSMALTLDAKQVAGYKKLK